MHVRNAPEKLFVTHFKDVMPPTLIAERQALDRGLPRRARRHRRSSRSSATAARASSTSQPGDENLNALLELFTRLYREPMIVQRYLPEVRQGDKRIILVDGEPLGAMMRVPPRPARRAPTCMSAASGQGSDSPSATRRSAPRSARTLKERGLVFVGIDVIGDYLTEINVTSPTGIQEINRFDGTALEIDLGTRSRRASWRATHLRPM